MISYCAENNKMISIDKLELLIKSYLNSLPNINKVLIIPPDITRKHSGAGIITKIFYKQLEKEDIEVKIMPALGSHAPMLEEKIIDMFGDQIPLDVFLAHDWRKGTISIGEVPKSYIRKISNGMMEEKIKVEINSKIANNEFDHIFSIGQVLPHEVVGMANYTKNIVVGCGGKDIIDKSHFLGAIYGMEKLIGKDHSPVRKMFDYIENNFLNDFSLSYILTVNKSQINEENNMADIVGFFAAKDDTRRIFENAVKLSQKHNITYLDQAINKFLVYLDPSEFTSTWLGNKAIYRTRLAIKDGGEIIVIAPGLRKIGEDEKLDKLIKKYGYINKNKVLQLVEEDDQLKNNLAVAAHIIHGSTENRFSVKYASDSISPDIIRKINYKFVSIESVKRKFNFKKLEEGFNYTFDGEKFYYIKNPATGLWVSKEKFNLT